MLLLSWNSNTLHIIKIADDVALRLGLFKITEITDDIRRQPLYRELGLLDEFVFIYIAVQIR